MQEAKSFTIHVLEFSDVNIQYLILFSYKQDYNYAYNSLCTGIILKINGISCFLPVIVMIYLTYTLHKINWL